MFNHKYKLLFLFLLFAQLPLSAQDLPTEQVEVIKSFDARLLDAERFNLSPRLPDVDTSTKRQVYNISSRSTNVEYLPPKISESDIPAAADFVMLARSLISDARWIASEVRPIAEWADILADLVDVYLRPADAETRRMRDEQVMSIGRCRLVFRRILLGQSLLRLFLLFPGQRPTKFAYAHTRTLDNNCWRRTRASCSISSKFGTIDVVSSDQHATIY